MKRIIFSIGILATSYLLLTTSVRADVSCQPIYGGGISCPEQGNLVVNKKVTNPQTNTLVDGLDINGPKFGPGQIATFQITVTNNGSAAITGIVLKDVFPQFVNMLTTSTGSFDANTKTLTINIDSLGQGETKTFNIQGQVVSSDQLTLTNGVVCVVNQATATSSQTGQVSQDNTQFCIQQAPSPTIPPTTKGGLKVFPPAATTTTPPTGPEMLPLLALIPTGITGLLLRRKSIARNKKLSS